MGHIQTFREPERTSALSPKADIGDRYSHVCLGPLGDITPLSDNHVSAWWQARHWDSVTVGLHRLGQ